MKVGWHWPLLIVAALLQVALAGVLPYAAPNIVMVYLVFVSAQINYIPLLWLALTGGLILDLYGSSHTFGLNIGFCLLVVLVTKTMIRLEEQVSRLGFGLLLVSAYGVAYVLLAAATMARSASQIIGLALLYKIVAEIGYNGVIAGLIYVAFDRLMSAKDDWRRLRVGG